MQSVQTKPQYKPRPVHPNTQPKKKIVRRNGNVVYAGDRFATKKVQQPKAAVKRNAKPKQKTGIASTLIVLFVAFCALTLLVSRYAVVCSIGSQNNELKKQLKTIEANMDNLAVDLELKDDIDYVHTTAQVDLGMKYPDPSQKITISLDG